MTIKFPASKDPDIRGAQEILVQAWAYVGNFFYDPSFNNQDWNKLLQDSLAKTFQAQSRSEALAQVNSLLGALGDPFTRVLLPQEAQNFHAQTQGKVISTGLVLEADRERRVRVLFVAQGSPAQAAGLRVGDEVVAVNGMPVAGQDPHALRTLLRHDIDLKVMRPNAPGGRTPAAAAQPALPAFVTAVPAQPAAPGGGDGGGTPPPPLPHVMAPGAELVDTLLPQPHPLLPGPAIAAAATGGDADVSGASSLIQAAAAAAQEAGGPLQQQEAQQQEAQQPQQVQAGPFALRPPPVVFPTLPAPPLQSAPVAAAPATTYALPRHYMSVHLKPAPVEFLPVQHALLVRPHHAGGPAGVDAAGMAAAAAGGEARTGYVRIITFASGVGEQVERALQDLKAQGARSWILDLRDNPGGIVGQGAQVARLMLQPGDVFARVRDQSGVEQETLLEDARALLGSDPLVVLVNRHSASTSELLAGALHDDAHALLLGERTYGKGRTQAVVPLSGGAVLLVTTDFYTTPSHTRVDGVGLRPDVACRDRPAPHHRVVAAAGHGHGTQHHVHHAGGAHHHHHGGSAAATEVEALQRLGSMYLQDPCIKAGYDRLAKGQVRTR